ncbi:MAG: DegV family protein [Lachnospiraceae bacterium]|nr:DegV family protein [Lachnospiraceae bacterium]
MSHNSKNSAILFHVTTDSAVARSFNKNNITYIDCKKPTTDCFISAWTPLLESGADILHMSTSSSVSTAYDIASATALYLKSKFPGRKIIVFDTLSVSLGTAFQSLSAAKLSEEGNTIKDAVKELLSKRDKQVELFSSNPKHIRKPILKVNYCGEIVVDKTAKGRLNALKALVDDFVKNHDKNSSAPVGIAYEGSSKDANKLMALLKKVAPNVEFFTISEAGTFHFGKNTVALVYTCA